METLRINFESVLSMLETTKSDRQQWHKKERTLAKLLKLAQTKEMLPITSKIFKVVSLPTNGKLTQTNFLSNYCKHFVEKKGVNCPAYVNKVTVWERDENGKVLKDKNGNMITRKDKDGNTVYSYKLTVIKDGTWTLEKLLKACTK